MLIILWRSFCLCSTSTWNTLLTIFILTWNIVPIYEMCVHRCALSQCSTAVKKGVITIQKVCLKKSLTKAEKEWKERVVEKLLFNRKKTEIQLNFYVTVLPLQIICTCVWTERAHDASYSWWAYFGCPPFLPLFSENPDTSRHLLKKAFSIRCN